MTNFVIMPTATSQWHALIHEAQQSCAITLNEELESYLVFLLMRFLEFKDAQTQCIALDWLDSIKQMGQQRQEILREVGDKCLFFSGLFPGIARKRRVSLGYYVRIGKSAYFSLSEHSSLALASLYGTLGEHFVPMMDVLHATRELGDTLALDPLQAEELWRETGSIHAKKTLQHLTTDAELINNFYPTTQIH